MSEKCSSYINRTGAINLKAGKLSVELSCDVELEQPLVWNPSVGPQSYYREATNHHFYMLGMIILFFV